MAQSATEDMLSLALVIAGIPLTGYAGGGAIRFVSTQPAFTMRVGVGGLGSYTRMLDDSGTLSTDLLPTSDGNDVLTAFFNYQKSRANGAVYAVSLIDTTGRFSLITGAGVIAKAPDITFGDGSGVNTWDILGVKWSQVTGGRGATPVITNAAQVPDLADIPGIRNAA